MRFRKVGSSALLTFCLLFGPPLLANGASTLDSPVVASHDLNVELIPERHELISRDHIELRMKTPSQTVVFTLAPMLKVESILMTTRTAPSDQSTQAMRAVLYTSEFLTEPPSQKISVSLPVPHDDTVTLVWTYRGPINDPPREPRHLRFVTPSETSGYIGSEGVYLSSESQWYPQPEGSSLNRFRVKTALPVGWKAVTLGKEVSERTENGKVYSEWNVRDETEALTLVANRFVVASRNWTSPDGGTIELSTYFLSDNADLADEYLDATEKYLKAYIPILGPYPFEKFAVVENFFASGLGMPSFTLLGSGSIKRHYVQPYALGHEIVHSWIGNSVFNRIDGGNWVEGLTTYLANYYWHELVNDQVQARDQRRQMVEGYNLYVPPERDYPVVAFRQKRDERDNAIGYQKTAMTFYHLRAEVGDQVFWRALRKFVSQYEGRFAEWRDLERVWSEESGQNLRWFFVQWVERPGAPNFAVTDVIGRTGRDGKEPYEVVVSVDQTDPPARTAIPIRVQLENGHEHTVVMPVRAAHETVIAALPARPMRIQLDPDFTVFRRIERNGLPPVLNHFVTDSRRTVLGPPRSDGQSPLGEVVTRIESQNSQKSEPERTIVAPLTPGIPLPSEGSVLLLGGPEQRELIQGVMSAHCGNHVSLHGDGFSIDGTNYKGSAMAALVTCHRKDAPGSVVSLLYAVSPQAVTRVARLLFFYGWNSVVVFQDGSVLTRSEWQSEQAVKEVRREAS